MEIVMQYELRTSTGTRVMTFDQLDRAKAFQAERAKRHQIKLTVWEIVHAERRVA